MSKVTIQIPAEKKLRDRATRSAVEYGFSSLQEMLRLVMNKIANKEIKVSLEENVEYLTPQEEAILEQRHREFIAEKKKGKTFVAHSAKEMLEQLMS